MEGIQMDRIDDPGPLICLILFCICLFLVLTNPSVFINAIFGGETQTDVIDGNINYIEIKIQSKQIVNIGLSRLEYNFETDRGTFTTSDSIYKSVAIGKEYLVIADLDERYVNVLVMEIR
jgi:hypothetical protein